MIRTDQPPTATKGKGTEISFSFVGVSTQKKKKIIERTFVWLQIIVICVVLITASYSPAPSKQQLLGVRDGNLGENMLLMAELFPTDTEFLG